MKTQYTHRPKFTARDKANLRVLSSITNYPSTLPQIRRVHLPEGASLRSGEPDPATLGVRSELIGVR